MADQKRNTWSAKAKRTLTCLLPIDKKRTGKCLECNECCKLPVLCPFLKPNKEGKLSCSIYIFRPLNCRKYPRTESEWITKERCGYSFQKEIKK